MAKAAAGPWEVTGTVPKQIYEIPVSSPSHSVTYVTVEDSSDDWVVFASAAAYTGVMVAWGCAVWGTGYYYPPYVRYGGGYPIYRPFYPTYGYSAWYNPWTGSYGRGAAVYGPYGGAGVGARYNPSTGTYARGAAAWGPYGGAAVGSGLQRANGDVCARRRRRRTLWRSRRGGSLQPAHRRLWRHASGLRRLRQLGPDRRAARRRLGATSRVTNRATGTTTRVTEGSGGGSAVTRNPRRRWRRVVRRAERAAVMSTPGATATSTGSRATAGRSTTTAAGTTHSSRRRSSGRRRRTARRRPARRRAIVRVGLGHRFRHGRPAQSRFGRAQQRRAADARCRQRAQRLRRLTRGQLPAERRRVARRRHVARRRAAPVSWREPSVHRSA